MWQILKNGFHGTLNALYGLYFWTVFAACALLTLALVAVLPQPDSRRRAARSIGGAVFRLTGSWPKIKGLEHFPNLPSVVVANHASYLDGILMTAVLPHRYQFVVKREMTRLPLVHFFLRRLGVHFVERFDPQRGAADTRKLLSTASEGKSLAFFPEGTFRPEPGLRRFHSGAFAVASRNAMPIIPVAIRGTRRMLPADRWLPRPGRLEVIVMPALNDGAAVTDADMAREQSRTRILAELYEIDLAKE